MSKCLNSVQFWFYFSRRFWLQLRLSVGAVSSPVPRSFIPRLVPRSFRPRLVPRALVHAWRRSIAVSTWIWPFTLSLVSSTDVSTPVSTPVFQCPLPSPSWVQSAPLPRRLVTRGELLEGLEAIYLSLGCDILLCCTIIKTHSLIIVMISELL
jgi:hypothetical protein